MRDVWEIFGEKETGGCYLYILGEKKKRDCLSQRSRNHLTILTPLRPPPPSPEGTVTTTVKFFKWFEIMKSYIFKHNLTQSPVPQYIYIYIYINANIYQKIKLDTITLIILRFECGVLKLSPWHCWASRSAQRTPLGLWAMGHGLFSSSH